MKKHSTCLQLRRIQLQRAVAGGERLEDCGARAVSNHRMPCEHDVGYATGQTPAI